MKRNICSECGSKISSYDIKDGLARQIKDKIYCRTCLLDLGLLSERRSDTESFITEVRSVLGEVELSPQETVLVERKTRVQVVNLIEDIIKTVNDHPSWGREEILRYIRSLL
jgi:hypothetical protein